MRYIGIGIGIAHPADSITKDVRETMNENAVGAVKSWPAIGGKCDFSASLRYYWRDVHRIARPRCQEASSLPDRRSAAVADSRQGHGAGAALGDDALALYHSGDILAIGLAGQPCARAHAWRHRLLQRQSAHQLHQRLRGRVPPVRLRPQEGLARRLHHGAGRSLEHRGHRLHAKPSPSSTSSAACTPTCRSSITSI